MRKIIRVRLDKRAEADIAKGQVLIAREAAIDKNVLQSEGDIIHIIDQSGKFLAKAYYGEQNKGIGWVLSRDEQEKIDITFFKSKLAQALQARKHFFKNKATTAFRVFNGEGDGIGGLTIDYYDEYFMVSWYSAGIFSFRNEIYEAIEALTPYKAIYEKRRFDTQGQYIEQDDFVKGTAGDFPIIVKENNMQFAVDLNDGAMTGIFLDQRDVRKAIRDKYAQDKTVLNTFSYTGAFSVAAALGGASKTVSVDLASRSKPKTIEQFSVNAIDYEAQEIRVMDVFDYFRYAKRHALKFDLVILDPPSFARAKKYTFSTARNYPALMKDAIALTNNGGVIVASTNNASFGMKKFKTFLDKACKETNTKYEILEQYSLPSDFKTTKQSVQSNYLKVVILRIQTATSAKKR